MTVLPLQRESIEPRIDGILKDVALLKTFAELSYEEFCSEVVLDRAQLHLRFALEGVFHIGSHILSRIPGGRFTEYKEIAKKLGEARIVSKEFAEKKLIPMAGYRNRLTHFYAKITARELYQILQEHLGDVDDFLHAVKQVLEHPEKFDLTME